ncbi:ras guanine nucleotide exchange factor domain-containing protein [Dactylonectria estremocensis]|uniref:Ras guanine nucleotide exchange factor domain-containing protein n=1 Tax=Dactylonectria estremocensis TaxID=1079267 RepID=A0A9P9ECT1_9HYPO|nr:ras guanine nucleotide exchange factor domain-containing protein [Dactylonectria estremocensis]
MTPPATPNGSQEDLSPQYLAPPAFHNFLRAFYPFNPSYAMSDTSVTLPLNEGDVILVHSIHTNGWADGTLLISGARGWLPTNYCESYEPDDMCSLLKALLNFWDLLRSTTVNDREIFGNQEFMKGIIAGVRFLLERTNCLNRESPFIQRNDVLRKCRKSLLSELSSLVKSAKRLQESQRPTLSPVEDVNDIVDEMILKAFRIVTKAVRFVDVLEDDRRARAPASVTVMATVLEESYVPPTPPADQSTFDDQTPRSVNDTDSQAAASVATSESSESTQTTMAIFNKRLSSLGSPTGPSSHRLSQASLVQAHRLSASISHRVSLAGPSPLSRAHHLVSERLNRTHDTFLSHLGSFIGRLHLQSQSRPELASAIKQSALSGGELLAVVDGVYEHINSSSQVLALARATMFDRIQDLVFSARDTLANAESEEADVIMPQDNSILLSSATGCVRAAGDCVAKAKIAIERIGDFEFELESSSLGIDLSVLDIAPEERPSAPIVPDESHRSRSSSGSSNPAPSAAPAPRRLTLTGVDKPLPEVPQDVTTPTEEQTPQNPSPASSRPSSANDDHMSSMASSISSLRPSLPPLPKLSTSLLPSEDYSPIDNHDHDYSSTSRFESMVASSAGSSATYLSRDSESSIISQTSTRATTPDHTLAPRNQPSMSELSTTGSSHAEEVDDVESRLMEKTFAHELMFNKEGLVTGGSIQALVERLTTHESTPDAMFVSTFYLTFRLFCTPVRLAEALIERFDYVSESRHMAGPVRLRVYNVLKGWLESHWRDETDREALSLIMPFSEIKLSSVLPSAGRRLLELAQRVSGDGSLVPRLVSSMGKTNTSIGQYVPADTPLPQSAVSGRQMNLLASFKNGTSSPTILDFEPVELARQLTIKQMNIFCSILPEELLGSQWMKKGGVSAPNVKAMSSLSTDLSNLVAETILQHMEIKKRAAVIKQWIKIAHQCLELHNYDGLMAIICSLNSSTISRLRKTWDAVSAKRKEMLRTLQDLVEPSQNNKVLRTRLHDHVPPCLPFLGMYLTDLTFVDIGNPATKQMSLGNESEEEGSNGITVINFDKHTRTAKIIGELQRFQIPYRLTEIPDMQDWMSAQIKRVREGDQGNVQVSYYRKSLLLEPRETALRVPSEPQPTTSLGALQNASRTDLFAWMSRDRGNSTSAPAQV